MISVQVKVHPTQQILNPNDLHRKQFLSDSIHTTFIIIVTLLWSDAMTRYTTPDTMVRDRRRMEVM